MPRVHAEFWSVEIVGTYFVVPTKEINDTLTVEICIVISIFQNEH